MRLRLISLDCTGTMGYYGLGFKPDNPAKPVEAIVKHSGGYRVFKAWVDYVNGEWAIELPITEDNVELIGLVNG